MFSRTLFSEWSNLKDIPLLMQRGFGGRPFLGNRTDPLFSTRSLMAPTSFPLPLSSQHDFQRTKVIRGVRGVSPFFFPPPAYSSGLEGHSFLFPVDNLYFLSSMRATSPSLLPSFFRAVTPPVFSEDGCFDLFFHGLPFFAGLPSLQAESLELFTDRGQNLPARCPPSPLRVKRFHLVSDKRRPP